MRFPPNLLCNMYVTLCMAMVPVWEFWECVFVGCTVLMLLYFWLVEALGAVNIHYFVWKFQVSAIYEFSFVHSLLLPVPYMLVTG